MNSGVRLRKWIILLPWVILLILLPLYPKEALEAAIRGISIWWEVLFPALFPFFVVAELLLGFGIVHYIGCLFDPMMRPIFRVPGYGGFVMAMGFASGYPIGARLTSQLWDNKLVNREEGERLVAFTTTSDPIFLIGAVSVGFFHDASLAVVLAITHYGAGVLVGLCMRYHGDQAHPIHNPVKKKQGFILTRALAAMHEARIRDNRPLGQLLQEAVQSGLRLVFMVGGLVVFVSVLLELLSLTGLLNISYTITAVFLNLLAVPAQLAPAFVNGIFEVTLGSKDAGAAGASSILLHQVAMASFLLSWAGLSVHAQIASILTPTNLRYTPFVFARLLHGILAATLVYVLWVPLQSLRLTAVNVLPTAAFGDLASIPLSMAAAAIVFAGVLVMIPILYILFMLFSFPLSIMMRRNNG